MTQEYRELGPFDGLELSGINSIPAAERQTTIQSMSSVLDERDNKHYLIWEEVIGKPGSRLSPANVLRGGEGTFENPIFTLPFSRANIAKLLKQTNKATSFNFARFPKGGTCCKDSKAVSKGRFLEAAL